VENEINVPRTPKWVQHLICIIIIFVNINVNKFKLRNENSSNTEKIVGC